MGLPMLIELRDTIHSKLISLTIFIQWKLCKMSKICNPYICIYELHIFILFIFTANVKGFLKHLNILSKIYKHLFSHLCHQINDKFTPLFCAKNMRKIVNHLVCSLVCFWQTKWDARTKKNRRACRSFLYLGWTKFQSEIY